MKKNILITLFLCPFLFCYNSYATVYKVGSTQTYTAPSQVASLVTHGDTIEIDPETYLGDVASWYANNLYFKGIGGNYAQLNANGNSAEQKAIWVIKGNNCVIENIEFLNCTVPDQNGAGIRQEGQNLLIKHCYFHHNEMGILAGDKQNSNITIEYSEFGHNGYGDGYSHNVYINHIDTLIFRYNYSHNPIVGHTLKTRARHNYILYNRITEENGNGSYTIDVPNGGETLVIGNLIEQGANSENSTIIEYGAEGFSNAIANFVVVNNTIVNNRPSGTFFYIAPNTNLFKLYNNLVLGNGTYINGTPTNLDTLGNLRYTDIATANLINPAAFDYRLQNNSPAINIGVNAGLYQNIDLTPQNRYLHPQSAAARIQIGNQLDVGAYEFIDNNCTFFPVINSNSSACVNNISIYSVLNLLGSTYLWSVTGGTIQTGQGTNQITVLWNNGTIGTVNIQQTVP